ncbi:Flp pilus assembly protein CpaB [Paraburkholderia aromaticivorans]|uniref:Flp pilus assembly protein CpaB n=1 Tax=Paraburkholderia aromaticivorans TaxID=2026199 RepID=UPI001F0EDA7A|nr:Flp pilus assembly protein CpaB [Paraburkholderia aromaticivorans]
MIALIVRVVIMSGSHQSKPVVDTQKVLVSAADLPQGLLLRDEDLAWKAVPVADVPLGAIVSGAPDAPELKGALLRHAAASGTVLVAEDVILPSAPGFLAATLKPEMRAVSVAVDDVSGNAGLIQPGDYVDLLLTQQMDRRTDLPDLAVSSETVVEHVRVLAVGSEIKRPKTGDAPDAVGNRARTVTLEVTPRTGEVVSVAARLGNLSLALRSFATASRDPAVSMPASSAQPAPVWAGDISRAVRDLPRSRAVQVAAAAPAPVALRPVAIYRGSEKADATASVAAGGDSASPPLPSIPASR